MARTSFKLAGDEALRRRLRKVQREKPKQFGRALYEEGEDIMRESKLIVPVATPELSGYSGGALRASGHVQRPVTTPLGITVELGYYKDYAVYVHEIPPPPQKSPKGRSARHMPPTQWKYLETPFNAAQAGMLGRLAAKTRDVL